MIAQLTSCHVIKLPWGTVENWRQLGVLVSHIEWDKAAAGVHPSPAPSPPNMLCVTWSACLLRTIPKGVFVEKGQHREVKFIFHYLTQCLAPGQPAHNQFWRMPRSEHSWAGTPHCSCCRLGLVLLCKITCCLQWVPDLSSQQFIASHEPICSNFCVDPVSNIYKRCTKSAGVLITHWAQTMVRDSSRLLPRDINFSSVKGY